MRLFEKNVFFVPIGIFFNPVVAGCRKFALVLEWILPPEVLLARFYDF